MRSVILLLGFFTSTFSWSQPTAEFETTFYFEDAIGNRDSIIIGYDPDANREFNPDFGEVDIDVPFDSIFEVRGAHLDEYLDRRLLPEEDILFSKKIITNSTGLHSNQTCYLPGTPIIFSIQARHQPVSVSWDKSLFNTSHCLSQTVLTNHIAPLTVFEWWQGLLLEQSQCVGEEESYSTSFNYTTGFEVFSIEEIEEHGQDTVYGCMLYLLDYGSFDSHCRQDVVSTENIEEDYQPQVYPNPTSDIIRFGDVQSTDYSLYDDQGELINSGLSHEIDLSDYRNGIYFVKYKLGNYFRTEKIIKMD